jgi:inositol phosphorylceramide mannosyltransferase catalytic subunit
MGIPKIIHQIWIQGADVVPKRYTNKINSLKTHNPEYQYILWDETNILKELDKLDVKYKNTYFKLEHLHQKADFGRYCLLYSYGGVYVDIDAYSKRGFDNILSKTNKDLIVSSISLNYIEAYISCRKSKCLNNGVILSSKSNKKILEIMNKIVEDNKCKEGEYKVNCIVRTTGPRMFSQHLVESDEVEILDAEYLEPCTCGSCKNITDKTIIVHEHDSTWYDDKLKMFLKNYMEFKPLIFLSILGILIVILLIYKNRN